MLTRRDVLRGMGGWSVTNAVRMAVPGLFAAAMTGCCEKSSKLNVILHGLFVLNITNTNIQLLTPKVDEHIYRAGDWHYGDNHNVCLDPAKYVLQGVCDAGKIPGISTETIVLSQDDSQFDIDPSPSYFQIDFPFPEKLTFLRSVKGASLYRGTGVHATGMALCTMLTYSRSGTLALFGSKWEPLPENQAAKSVGKFKIRNLHIWAEPATRTNLLHAEKAYAKLMCFFKPRGNAQRPNFTIATDDSPPLDHPGTLRGLGVTPEEEMGWSEWVTNGEGSRPTNCNTVVVVPTAPS